MQFSIKAEEAEKLVRNSISRLNSELDKEKSRLDKFFDHMKSHPESNHYTEMISCTQKEIVKLTRDISNSEKILKQIEDVNIELVTFSFEELQKLTQSE